MSYANAHVNGESAPQPRGMAHAARVVAMPRVMPRRILLKLFLSTLAALLAIHFWKHAGR